MTQRILIVGHGSIGRRHLRIVRESLPQADLRVLRRSGTLEAEGADGCFTSLDQALAFGPHAAIVASPAPFHVITALALVRQGCHVLVEKPLSDTTDGVAELLDAVREQGVVLQVGYNLRHLHSLGEFRRQVQSGRIGRVLSVRCESGQHIEAWRPGMDYRTGVSARRELGGGVLLELSHELDYLRWIFGEIDWVSAWTGRQGALDVDVEDTAHLLLGMAGKEGKAGPDGPVAVLSLDFLRRDTTRRCTVIGEKGSLVWDGVDGIVQLHTGGQGGWDILLRDEAERDQTYRDQWWQFLESIEQSRPMSANGSDGLAVLEVILAARRSAEAGCVRVLVARRQGGE